MYSFSISCLFFFSIKFYRAINLLLICRELFYIILLVEILNHDKFSQLQVSELLSSHTQINVAKSYGTQIQPIYEDKP